MNDIVLRPILESDKSEYAELLYHSFNVWYRQHGREDDYFKGGPQDTEIFYDVYNDLDPGCCIVAVDKDTKRLMGCCFYHPREYHVSLGVMSVHPDYFGRGIGKQLVDYIVDYAENNKKALRVVSSAVNIDSFSLYNKADILPRYLYHNMIISVPAKGMNKTVDCVENVRSARVADIPAMMELEMEVSGISREKDFHYAIENRRGIFQTSVIESNNGSIEGFMISLKHPSLNMIGPGVVLTEEAAIALILHELDRYKGETAILLIPMDRRKIVGKMYECNAKNSETYLFQVRGKFKPFNGVNIPSFLPETG